MMKTKTFGFLLLVVLGAVCPAHAFLFGPPASLVRITDESDLVFKGVALESQDVNNDAQLNEQGFKAQDTRFRVVSVLKGAPLAEVAFRHYRQAPSTMFDWHPQFYSFQVGAPYLVWAKRGKDGVWRQSATAYSELEDPGAMRAGDDAPASGEIRRLVWHEWEVLLASNRSEDVVYALSHLVQFSSHTKANFLATDDFQAADTRRVALPFLSSGDAKIVEAAIKTLQAMGAEEVRPQLLTFASSSAAPSLRAQALAALGGNDSNASQATQQAARQLLAQPQQASEVQAAALLLLSDLGEPQTRSLLLQFSQSSSPSVRSSSAFSMGRSKRSEFIPRLMQLTDDHDPQVREAALRAMTQMPPLQARPFWEKLRRSPDVEPTFTVLLGRNFPDAYLPDLTRIVVEDRLGKINLISENEAEVAWHTLFGWLEKRPASAWNTAQIQSVATALEHPKMFWSSSDQESLYKLERERKQDKRAKDFRAQQEKTAGFGIGIYFRRADEEVARETSR